MVPVPEYTTIYGIPMSQLMPKETVGRLVQRTINGGAEIVEYLKTGSAFYAPSASVAKMVEAVVRDSKRILPCAAYLQGEYNESDVYLGVPVKLGNNGIEKIIELELTDEQSQALANSATAVREGIAKL
ncbi:MAG: malate dehydrogenase, partial [Methanosarcinaceae archaeon]